MSVTKCSFRLPLASPACFARTSLPASRCHCRSRLPEQQPFNRRSAATVGLAAAASSAQSVASEQAMGTSWFQKTISLPNHKRGCHVVTRQILKELPELAEFEVGLASFFVQHTSCSLTINENASPDVPLDLNDYLNKVAPEGNHYRPASAAALLRLSGSSKAAALRRHLDEGLDDMPAHLKSSLMGVSLTIPVSKGRLALGTWQGIYLNEHRDWGGTRRIVVTIQGQKRADGRAYSGY